MGYDAPSNIGIMLIGWLYGEGDFSKSLCIAVGCGEDADCTAATLGSIFGIIMGAENLPEKWVSPIGDKINTICVDTTPWDYSIPGKVSELTDRVCNLMPTFMLNYCNMMSDCGTELVMNSGEQLKGQDIKLGIYVRTTFRDEIKNHTLSVKKQGVIFDVIVKYNDGIHVKPEEEKKISLTIINKLRRQRWVTVKWHLLPEEWDVSPCRETAIFLDQAHGGTAVTYAEFVITPHTMKHGRNDFILELKANGSVGTMFIPITLFA